MLGAAHDPVGLLLGRDAETALLTSLLDGVRSGGAALVLRGEPGIGKSRLLLEAAALARERHMAILSTTGVQSEARLAFSGLHRMLRPVRALAAALPPAPRAAPDAAFGLGDDDALPEHFRVAMAVLDLLADFAAEAPLLVVVEDAHWLDRASSDVLAFVARRLESDPVVLLVGHARDGNRAALGGAGLPELRLEALDPAVAGKLIDASAPNLTTVTRDRLLSEAAGNPLAPIELPVAAARLEPGSPMPGRASADRAARAGVRRSGVRDPRRHSPAPADRRAQRRGGCGRGPAGGRPHRGEGDGSRRSRAVARAGLP